MTKEEIVELIINGRIDDALSTIRDLLKGKKLYSEALLLSSRNSSNKQSYRLGVLDLKDYQLEQNKITQGIIAFLDEIDFIDMELENNTPFYVEQSFKEFGNIKTKMIPIFPFKSIKPLKIENVIFDYYPQRIYDRSNHPYFYNEIENHVSKRKTIYNEAKPTLIDYIVTFNEEEKEHFMEIELGICNYIDFLAINRNLDTKISLRGEDYTIRKKLEQLEVDKDSINPMNNVSKPLGLNSIVVTNDNFIILQKRQKSEVASKMFHVSIAEGLQVYPSYKEFLALDKSEKQYKITDKTLSLALYRGLEEELGIEIDEVKEVELLSIYFDYELQELTFQTCTHLNISSDKLKQYFISSKGRDTLAEIKRLDFIPNTLHSILLYLYQTTQDGVWSSHAVINIISFIEKYFGNEKKINTILNKYFKKTVTYYLGEQSYICDILK